MRREASASFSESSFSNVFGVRGLMGALLVCGPAPTSSREPVNGSDVSILSCWSPAKGQGKGALIFLQSSDGPPYSALITRHGAKGGVAECSRCLEMDASCNTDRQWYVDAFWYLNADWAC